MIEFSGCDRCELEDALESLAYQVLQYQNPGWYEIPEDEIVTLLKNEGNVLPLDKNKKYGRK